MRDDSKKFLQKREDDHPPLGNFVHWFIKKQNVPKRDVVKYLGIVHTTLCQYFKQDALQFGIVWRISKAINYNMIMDLGERINIPYETKAEKKLKDELAEKNELLKKMEIQIELLKEMKK